MENRFTTKMEPVTRALILINILIFIIELILSSYGMESWFKPLIFDCANIVPHQFITYQFLHNGINHIYNNLIVLYFFGPACERFLGKTKFILLYLLFGVIAVFSHMLLSGRSDTIVGASGSIFGIVALFTLIEKSYLYIGERKILPIAAISFILIAMELPHIFDNDKIGHMAHMGGVVSGVITYFVFRPKKDSEFPE
jgi:membrane associated rhomboid family serine protease